MKEWLERKDYEDIQELQTLCCAADQTILKLDLDYKLSKAEGQKESAGNSNEFMAYAEDKLIGFIGISYFGGDSMEVNGMVHPEYRR